MKTNYKNKTDIKNLPPKPTFGIAVDGSVINGNPGDAEYRIVDIATGKIILTQSIGIGTNNHAEFIGLCNAIQLYPDQPIYSDSLIAIRWAEHKTHRSNYYHPYMDWCVDMLKELKHKPNVIHWKTRLHGEIPADFGRKN